MLNHCLSNQPPKFHNLQISEIQCKTFRWWFEPSRRAVDLTYCYKGVLWHKCTFGSYKQIYPKTQMSSPLRPN